MARSRQPRRDLDDNSVRAWKRAASLRCNYYIASEFIESFFVGARSLIERDAESMQDVIRYMSEEHGLRYIQQLVERDFASLPLPSRTDIFKAQMMPFLEIISHPKVLSSLVAEHPLGTIYNFIYGIGGTRAESFISTLCFALQSLREDDETRADWLEGSLAVFSRMMFVNSSAFAQAGLQEQVIKLSNILLTMEKGGMARRLQVSRRYLDQILRRVESGAHIATPSTERQSHIITLTPPQDPPGGRHDNDHTDFCMVKIMPTLDEIVSPQAEYLPERDPRCWHVRGLEGLLDRNFRLLREDSVGVLRDSIYQLIKDSQAANSQPAKSGPRTNLYRGVKSIRSYLHWNDGFLFQLEFPQPRYLHRMKPLERKAWWSQSKRLQTGALVCLTIGCSQIVFCTVIQSPDQHHEESQKMASRNGEKSRDPPIRESATGDSITLAAVRPDERTVQSILDYFDQPNQSFLMVEFPGVLVPGFDPTLRALQSMKRNGHFPFENLLVPSAFDGQATIPPPLYASREGFQFNLRCLTNNDTDFFVRPNEPADVQKLCMSSTLDEAQATALVSSLQRSIGLIQGPPGTGKSFTGIALIRVLLAHKHGSGGNIGPVLCISYSNHALDQLLESLLGQDITSNIVRIGSQSKSEKLRACNIRIVAKLATKTREERHLQARLRSELQGCEAAYSKLPLRHVSEANLQQYLQQHHPHHSEQLFGEATNQGRFKSKDAKTIIRSWLTSGSVGVDQFNRSFEDLTLVNVHSMVRAERTRIYQHWLEHLAKLTRCEALKIVSTYSDAKRDWDLVRGELDLRCLADADVIGVTTSGLARNLDVLRKLQSKVIVCEEAGEILEAHLLTALLPSVEHAILIGDHLQLRPQVQNYNLSRENHNGGDRYSLDVSLFERLVSTKSSFGLGLPYTALETQRRMHPSIARLIRDTMYPGLKDADEVTEYPKVSGMKKRLFWLDHKFYEESTADDAVTTSHWNAHEVEMTVALVHHLVNQGKYKSCDLAVLTPYLGQLHRLRHKLSQSFAVCVGERDEQDLEKAGLEPEDNITPAVRSNLLDALRVATVDNFQGEEAKIIVISLVRSNPQNRCGFMDVRPHAESNCPVDTPASANAMSAPGPARLTMGNVGSSAAEITPPADIYAECLATEKPLVHRAMLPARFAATTPDVHESATSHAHHVQKTVFLLAYMVLVRCLVLRLATTSHVLGVVKRKSDVAINARLSAASNLYAEVDLNKNPCIFPNCGHFLTMESMDAQIGLEKYYNLSHDGTPITIKASAEPFRMEDIKNCALCRGHLRDLSRYGRLVRQAILDESTKKLILYINREFVPLAKDLANCIQRLQRFPYKQKVALPAVLRITGSRANQVQTMRTAVGNLSVARWGDMFRLREMIDIYGCRVSPDEQPSTRVSATVENARRRHQVSTAKSCGDGAIIQDKGVLLATALSTRLEIALLMDLMRMRGRTRVKILINLEDNRKECGSFINMARVSKRPALEAEGHVYLAQLHAIERWHCADASFSKEHLDNGRAALEKARSIVKVFPNQTRGLESEIDAAESMFLSTFYSAVSNAERLAVVQAMAREFVGTGHWYRCQNGHPFTIGECGGAMQESTCPECGSPVGGQRHQLVEG
ncbi:hypothetical protein BJY04DRAFT_217020, partial [Aspergillus karnatakaensis]|uniref:putative NF-X1 finger and helicase domain protein n=1 Tax=Aspergillus karnatakaensis TaxID=1810916 RepID=UPI003CCDE363